MSSSEEEEEEKSTVSEPSSFVPYDPYDYISLAARMQLHCGSSVTSSNYDNSDQSLSFEESGIRILDQIFTTPRRHGI